MTAALAILLIICPIAALTFAVRLAFALFSSKVAAQLRRHPVVHGVWGVFAFGGVLLYLGALNPWWPPPSVERRRQRQQVVERVQTAGGWAAVQRDCDALVAQHRDSAFHWRRGVTNALPPTLAALKPWSVEFLSPALLRAFQDEPQVAVVRIKVFGIHSTGGHSIPYFGLEVVSGPGAENYKPRPSRGGVSGNGYRSYSPVTDRIYEIY